MKFKSIISLSFSGIIAVGGLTAASLYLPQVTFGENFYGTQLIDNVSIYSKLNQAQPSGLSVFDANDNVAKFVGGTPNVSLEDLLNGTNKYANGNYIVLFASDGDPLSNLFLYGDAYHLNGNDNDEIVDYHNFGFSINDKTNQPEFNPNFVKANFANGYIQKAFQYLTSKKSLEIMSALPSVVLVHDKINYDVMQSLVSYQNYVKSCFHDVVISLNGEYSFAKGTKNYDQFAKNNPKLGPNYQVKDSISLFEGLVGYDKNMKESDKDYNKNQKLKEKANQLNKEYEWAKNLKSKDPVCFGFQFNPINSSFETNTYTDPNDESKPYRTDIGAKKYVEAITLFKNKLSPSYVSTTFTDKTNGGHYLGFAHSLSSEKSVVLNDELANVPKDSNGNENNGLKQYAGKDAGSKLTASLISLYNGVSNSAYKGISLLDQFIFNGSQHSLFTMFLNSDKKIEPLKTWYISK